MQATAATHELEMLLANMTQRQQIGLLLTLGVPAVDVIGIKSCDGHMSGRELRDHEGLTFDGYTVWCRGCSSWWAI